MQKKLGSGLGPLYPGGPWHLSSLVQWVLRYWPMERLLYRIPC